MSQQTVNKSTLVIAINITKDILRGHRTPTRATNIENNIQEHLPQYW